MSWPLQRDKPGGKFTSLISFDKIKSLFFQKHIKQLFSFQKVKSI